MWTTMDHGSGPRKSDPVAVAFAKLAGARKTVEALLRMTDGPPNHPRPAQLFTPDDAAASFKSVASQLEILKERLPDLFQDFVQIDPAPTVVMAQEGAPNFYDRRHIERLARTIDAAFEIRANSELAPPQETQAPRLFVSHGRATDWREVQAY